VSALSNLRRQLLSDKRKLGLMFSLCLVALLLWGRLLMKNVPRTAVATPEAAIAGAAGQTPAASTPSTDKPVKPPVLVAAYGPVSRDLFAFDPVHYGRIETEENGGNPLAKLVDEKVDEIKQRQQERMAVQAAAGQLRLQSTLLGHVNRAMINGVLLEPGQKILGFELTDVRARQVTLVRDGIEVTLEM